MPKLRVLVAGIAETNDRIAQALSGCEVTFVDRLNEATVALSENYDILLIAVRFDESRMFDLLRYARDNGIMDRIPIICYRSRPGPVTGTALALQAVTLACQLLGADAFFDLESYSDEEAGDQAIRRLVEQLVTASNAR